ncbi:RibD_C domain-containing protein [Haematococcus lacustris]|uniref:RibD_C domain-containing protein n=1 Tax=Haematococcus lacustris TaxID=44745 RepID=A0A699ZZD4_HAELA|nr:RibD_C domain-containing protein [Haematococcus lacustris]
MSSLAAARADNFYYAPDFDPDKHGTLNKFSMRHHCGCIITIQSDPKHCDYIVVEGAKKKVEGVQSAAEAGVIELTDDAEKERLLKDPIYRVEAGEASRKRARSAAEEVADLLEDAQAKHADPYAVNRVLRAKLRAVKQEEAALDAEHKALNLAEEVRLLPSSEADATAASLAFFAHATGCGYTAGTSAH